MGDVSDRYNAEYYYPNALAFSLQRGASGIEISGGVIRMDIYNTDGKRLGQIKYQFNATAQEQTALLTHIASRRSDFETAEGLTLLPEGLGDDEY